MWPTFYTGLGKSCVQCWSSYDDLFEPIDNVNSEMRRKAKEVNFGLIYGMEAFGLSKSLNISQKEAKKLIDAYFDQFPKVKGFLENVVSNAEKNTFTTTLIGRKRYIRELSSSNTIKIVPIPYDPPRNTL